METLFNSISNSNTRRLRELKTIWTRNNCSTWYAFLKSYFSNIERDWIFRIEFVDETNLICNGRTSISDYDKCQKIFFNIFAQLSFHFIGPTDASNSSKNDSMAKITKREIHIWFLNMSAIEWTERFAIF